MQKKLRVYENPVSLDMPFEEALNRFAKVNTKELEEEDKEEEETIKAGKAYPFIKWAGGKRSIINELTSRLPKEFNNYYEPFLGGAALYFEIYEKLKKAFLSDNNLDLIITYNVIKNDPKKLVATLKEFKERHSEEFYYKIRDMHNLEDPVQIAARFIYLNRTCYNGLFRTNKKGNFNVPMGRYTNPNIVQESNIFACSSALIKATMEFKDFEKIEPEKGDFVYFDPPYHPTNEVSFTQYTKHDFTEKDQSRLRDFIVSLTKKGVFVMLSNSKTKFVEDLYKSNAFHIAEVEAPRLVNCKKDKRKPVTEVLVTNYEVHSQGETQRKLHGQSS